MSDAAPRLLYVGDVPIESSYHGSALLYRLLETYPTERLRVVETGTELSLPERRLAGVDYRDWPLNGSRWLRSRFHRLARAKTAWDARRSEHKAATVIEGFSAQAVLTVGHGAGWLAAAEIARRLQVPLHFIVHDDWPRCGMFFPPADRWIDRQFGRVYRQAASRLCVSPAMRDVYAEMYGAAGSVLYPSRARNCADFDAPPARLAEPVASPLCIYAGSINSDGYLRQLRSLAAALLAVNGRLRIYGPAAPADLARQGLDGTNVEMGGLLTSTELIARCRREADFLFVPLSFAPADRTAMERNFPSKLTDCTAMGLPLLVCGPSSCSGVRWGCDNPGAAIVVDTDDPGPLAEAVVRLAADSGLRMSLAREALRVGRKMFSFETADAVFRAAVGLTSSSGAAARSDVPPSYASA